MVLVPNQRMRTRLKRVSLGLVAVGWSLGLVVGRRIGERS